MIKQVTSPLTSDFLIRTALKTSLEELHPEPTTRIIEELGLSHGAARVDIAVVNGLLHGYELKSDLDTLYRLPEQMRVYNLVLDQITLVVGKSHLYEAIKIVPDYWGITVAKIGEGEKVIFYPIREAEDNPRRDISEIVKLLWREEALNMLEDLNEARGVRSKSRSHVYNRLCTVIDQKALRDAVRERISSRVNWRAEKPLSLSDDLYQHLANS